MPSTSPTKTNRPPWATCAKLVAMAAALPVASNTTSKARRGFGQRRYAKLSREGAGGGHLAPARELRRLPATQIAPRPTRSARPRQPATAPRPQATTRDGVCADPQRLDQGELIQRQRFKGCNKATRQAKQLPHAAIDVNSQALQGLAAVVSPCRHSAMATAIGLDRSDRPAASGRRSNIGSASPSGAISPLQRPTHDPGCGGIGKEGLPPREGVQIRAADANATDRHQHLARRGTGSGTLAATNSPGCCSTTSAWTLRLGAADSLQQKKETSRLAGTGSSPMHDD